MYTSVQGRSLEESNKQPADSSTSTKNGVEGPQVRRITALGVEAEKK